MDDVSGSSRIVTLKLRIQSLLVKLRFMKYDVDDMDHVTEVMQQAGLIDQ